MRRERRRRMPIRIDSTGLVARAAFEPVTAEPNYLRDVVCRALSSLSCEKRVQYRDHLLAAIKKAGLNLSECLFMLGCRAETVEDLTAPELAALIRYARITSPNAMPALAAPIREILAAADLEVKVSGRAA